MNIDNQARGPTLKKGVKVELEAIGKVNPYISAKKTKRDLKGEGLQKSQITVRVPPAVVEKQHKSQHTK